MPTPRLPCLALFSLLPPLLAAAPASPALNQAWTALTNSRPQDVLRILDSGRVSRPERLAWAAARMSAQPATDDNMRAAEKILAELATGSDEPAAEAAYLQARLHQM